MKNAVIVHGWGGGPQEKMLSWLIQSLEDAGYTVIAPNMPDPENPHIGPWVGHLEETLHVDENTVLIGHSNGCQAILRYLETLPEDVRIKSVVLIAPWRTLPHQPLIDEAIDEKDVERVLGIAREWGETPIDYEKVKQHVGKITGIFSTDDPFVPLDQKDLFEQELGITSIIENDKGHFTESDGITELPSALNAVLES